MTTRFDRELFGFRFVEIRHGDTLQAIAARELGDGARWHEIVAYNNLVAPFITDDPAQARPGVALSGTLLRVPAPTPVVETTINPEEVFETDIELNRGQIMADRGDMVLVAGRANLRQALRHRIETDRGELLFHTGYGSRVRSVIGAVNGPTAALLTAQYARAAVQADPRVERVTRAEAQVVGDVVNASVEVEPVTGRPVDVNATI